MSQSAKVQEPSMEEILASIRRIISDESGSPEGAKPAPAPRPPAAAPLAAGGLKQTGSASPAASDDVLELTQSVEPVPQGFRPVSGPDVVFREGEGEGERREPVPPPMPTPAPTPVPKRAPAMAQPALRQDELLSPSSTAAVTAAFGSLATTILAENARTLEDLVKEMMRPMLKEWLDENLPGLVERMVRAEIERVSRGGR